MAPLFHLMRPKWIAFRRPTQGSTGRSPSSILFFFVLGFFFWWGIYQGAIWLCGKCLAIEDIGGLLLQKIMSMAFLTFFSVLLFSNLVTAFSSFFLSDDLLLLNSAPVPRGQLFLGRFFETLLHASWMIVVFGFPFLLAYGQAFQANERYYFHLLLVLLPFLLIPSAISIIVALLLAVLFPAKHTRDITLFLSVVGFAAAILYFRSLQPERFLNPERFSEVIEFLGMLRQPSSIFLPSDWAVSSLFPFLSPKQFKFEPVHLLALYTTAGSLSIIAFWLYEWLYSEAYSRAQEGSQKRYTGNRFIANMIRWISWPFSREIQTMLGKEFRTFLRNPGQWSQLLLLGTLVLVYVLNFSTLRKISSIKIQGIPAVIADLAIYVFNLILLGFVISAVAVRFAFPAVSLEGRSFWLIRQSPVTMSTFLRSKFWSVFIPLLFLAELLAISTNIFIHSTFLQTCIAAATVLCMTVGITSLGIGLGAMFPRFEIDNSAKIATGFGGVLYMFCAVLWIVLLIGLELLSLRHVLYARLTGSVISANHMWQIAGMCSLAVILTYLIYQVSLKMGARSLDKMGH